MLVQTEMERAVFLIRSYVRTRLAKVSARWVDLLTKGDEAERSGISIDREVLAIYHSHPDDTDTPQPSRTAARAPVCYSLVALTLYEGLMPTHPCPPSYHALVAAHYKVSVLDSLPPQLGSLEETDPTGAPMGASASFLMRYPLEWKPLLRLM